VEEFGEGGLGGGRLGGGRHLHLEFHSGDRLVQGRLGLGQGERRGGGLGLGNRPRGRRVDAGTGLELLPSRLGRRVQGRLRVFHRDLRRRNPRPGSRPIRGHGCLG